MSSLFQLWCRGSQDPRVHETVKLEETVEAGHSTVDNHQSQTCNGCGKQSAENAPLDRCSACMSVKYCNSACQKRHWKQHKVLCNAIKLKHQESVNNCTKACAFVSHITPKQRNRIAKLIGERCMIDCQIGGGDTSGLWDTGSQVCLISSEWLKKNNLNPQIHDLSDILERNLKLEGVNGTDIPYLGFV